MHESEMPLSHHLTARDFRDFSDVRPQATISICLILVIATTAAFTVATNATTLSRW